MKRLKDSGKVAKIVRGPVVKVGRYGGVSLESARAQRIELPRGMSVQRAIEAMTNGSCGD